jgi:hypothetical protein
VVRNLFWQVEIKHDDVLVDVGCGKGRVFAWWLWLGLKNRMIGIELNPAIARETAKRFSAHKQVEILAGDAIEQLPSNGTLFWLFNPFGGSVMREFSSVLKRKCSSSARVVYARSKHVDVFSADSDFTCKPLDPGWLATGPAHLITRQKNQERCPNQPQLG